MEADVGAGMDGLSAALRRISPDLSPAVARVASFLSANRTTVLASSAAEIARGAGTSNATVIRAVRALGFDGLPAFKRSLAATLDAGGAAEANMRRTLAETGQDGARAVDAALDAHREAMEGLTSREGRAGIVTAVGILYPATRIAIFGIGPSAHLARYMALQLARLGRRSLVLDATGWALADQLMGLEEGDALILLAYGEPYREVRAVTREARRRGVPIVLVTDATTSALARGAAAVLIARRGRANRVALHAETLAALEAVALGLAAADADRTMRQLSELARLRKLVGV